MPPQHEEVIVENKARHIRVTRLIVINPVATLGALRHLQHLQLLVEDINRLRVVLSRSAVLVKTVVINRLDPTLIFAVGTHQLRKHRDDCDTV